MHAFFFFNDTATTEIYTLSLHDALPIFDVPPGQRRIQGGLCRLRRAAARPRVPDLRRAGAYAAPVAARLPRDPACRVPLPRPRGPAPAGPLQLIRGHSLPDPVGMGNCVGCPRIYWYTACMRFGIDFGTTHTVVAVVDRGNYPIVSFEHTDAIPSIVSLDPEEIGRAHV